MDSIIPNTIDIPMGNSSHVSIGAHKAMVYDDEKGVMVLMNRDLAKVKVLARRGDAWQVTATRCLVGIGAASVVAVATLGLYWLKQRIAGPPVVSTSTPPFQIAPVPASAPAPLPAPTSAAPILPTVAHAPTKLPPPPVQTAAAAPTPQQTIAPTAAPLPKPEAPSTAAAIPAAQFQRPAQPPAAAPVPATPPTVAKVGPPPVPTAAAAPTQPQTNAPAAAPLPKPAAPSATAPIQAAQSQRPAQPPPAPVPATPPMVAKAGALPAKPAPERPTATPAVKEAAVPPVNEASAKGAAPAPGASPVQSDDQPASGQETGRLAKSWAIRIERNGVTFHDGASSRLYRIGDVLPNGDRLVDVDEASATYATDKGVRQIRSSPLQVK